mgnify:CR=1 FL=1
MDVKLEENIFSGVKSYVDSEFGLIFTQYHVAKMSFRQKITFKWCFSQIDSYVIFSVQSECHFQIQRRFLIQENALVIIKHHF